MLARHGPFNFQDAHQVVFVDDVAADGVQNGVFEGGPADPFLVTTGAALCSGAAVALGFGAGLVGDGVA